MTVPPPPRRTAPVWRPAGSASAEQSAHGAFAPRPRRVARELTPEVKHLADTGRIVPRGERSHCATRCLQERGSASYDVQDYDMAVAHYSAALSLEPRSIRTLLRRAVASFRAGDFESCIGDCDAVLRIDRKNVQALRSRGAARRMIGDNSLALVDFSLALKLEPDSVQALVNRSNVLFALGNFDGAVRDCDAALEIDPCSEEALVNRAACRCVLGDHGGALRDCDRVLIFQPKHFRALLNRALVRQAAGDGVGAVEDYEEVLRLHPRCQQALVGVFSARRLLSEQRHGDGVAPALQGERASHGERAVDFTESRSSRQRRRDEPQGFGPLDGGWNLKKTEAEVSTFRINTIVTADARGQLRDSSPDTLSRSECSWSERNSGNEEWEERPTDGGAEGILAAAIRKLRSQAAEVRRLEIGEEKYDQDTSCANLGQQVGDEDKGVSDEDYDTDGADEA